MPELKEKILKIAEFVHNVTQIDFSLTGLWELKEVLWQDL